MKEKAKSSMLNKMQRIKAQILPHTLIYEEARTQNDVTNATVFIDDHLFLEYTALKMLKS